MAIKAFEVYGDIVLKTDKANKQIDATGKKLQDIGKKMQDVGKKMSAFVTLPILGIGAAMVKLASDAEETNSKFNAVFKEQTASVKEWAEKFSDDVGRSTTANLGFLATIQDTLVPLGFMRDRAADMSKATVKLATDLASFNNLPTADVVRDIQSAIVGNTETLRKYGVVASQDAIIQEALAAGLIDNKNELDATSKAQAIYNILLKGTTDAQGDALRTADSTANQTKKLKAEVEDLAISFGQQLLPIVKDIIAGVSDAIKWFSELSEENKRTILTLAGIAAAAGPVIGAIGGISRAIGMLSSNPILLIASAVVAVGSALYIAAADEREYNKELKDTYKHIKNLDSGAVNLATELAELQGQTKLSADEQERQAEIVKTLKELYPELNDEVLANAQAVATQRIEQAKANKQALQDQVIILQKRKAVLEAAQQEELETVKKNLRKVKQAYVSGLDWDDQVAAINEFNDLLANTSSAEELIAIGKDIGATTQNMGQGFIYTTDKIEEITTAIDDARRGMATLNGVIGTNTVKLATLADQTKKTADETSGLADATEDSNNASNEMDIDEWKAKLQERLDALREERAEELADQIWILRENERLQKFALDKETARLKKLEDEYRSYAQTISGALGPVFVQLGAALIEQGDAWTELGRVAVSAIAGVVRGLGEQALIESALAFARYDGLGGALFAGAATAAFIASGVIDALAGSFEDGGVVPGSSFTGDKLLARVNSGERVLTAQQNAHYESMMREPASYETNNYYTSRSEDINVSVSDDVLFRLVQRGLDTQRIIPGRRGL